MGLNPSAVFVNRPAGTQPVQIDGTTAPMQAPIRAVLQAHDGRVLVKEIELQPDGTFIGAVYGIMPQQRSVAVGDVVRFEEGQIFRFEEGTVQLEGLPGADADADADMRDLIRQVEEVFRDEPESAAAVKQAHVQPVQDVQPERPAMPRETQGSTSTAAEQKVPRARVPRSSVDRRQARPAADDTASEPKLGSKRTSPRRGIPYAQLGVALAIGLGIGYLLPRSPGTATVRPAMEFSASAPAKLKIDHELHPLPKR